MNLLNRVFNKKPDPAEVIGCSVKFHRNEPFKGNVRLSIRVWDGKSVAGLDRIAEVNWPLFIDRERVPILLDMAKSEIMEYLGKESK